MEEDFCPFIEKRIHLALNPPGKSSSEEVSQAELGYNIGDVGTMERGECGRRKKERVKGK